MGPSRKWQTVQQGDVLLRLRNSDLEMEVASLSGQQQTVAEQIESLQRTLLKAAHVPPEERNRLSNELSELRQRAVGLHNQLEICRRKERELTVLSPVSGQIATWAVEDGLRRRPVRKGEVLMTVVNPEGAWELELEVPQRDVAHVVSALAGAAASQRLGTPAAESNGGPCAGPPVTFEIQTLRGRKFAARLVEVERMARERPPEDETVLVRAAIADMATSEFLCGAAAKGRIACGKRSVGFVWLRDLIETVQSEVLFWF
jgi:hypothetical protein